MRVSLNKNTRELWCQSFVMPMLACHRVSVWRSSEMFRDREAKHSARMRFEDYGSYLDLSFCPSVCLSSVRTTFSATMRNKAAKKQYPNRFSATLAWLKMAFCILDLVLRSNVMAWKPSEQANMLMSMAYVEQIFPVLSPFSWGFPTGDNSPFLSGPPYDSFCTTDVPS